MPGKTKGRKQTKKKTIRKNSKIKSKRDRKYRKTQKNRRKILQKAITHIQNKPKKLPVAGTAKEFVQKAMKNMNKGNHKKASLQLISALTILASYNPMAEQKFDMGSISNLRTGPLGVPTANTMIKYHDPTLNMHQNNTLSKKELRFLSKHHPQIYESIMM